MKDICKIVQDLLPLYRDDVCSTSSKEMIDNHLLECEPCRKMLAQLQDDTCVQSLQNEYQNVIAHHNKHVKQKSVILSSCIAGLFTIPILVCLIINLITGHTLNWFFIVLTGMMVTASVTVVPLVFESNKFLWTITSFTISLLLLLLCCCIYSGGNWFFIAAISVLLGLSVIFMPAVLGQIHLNKPLCRQNLLLSLVIDTFLLYILIFTCGFYADSVSYWRIAFLITTICIVFIWLLFFLFKYTRLHKLVKSGICVISIGIFNAVFNDIVNWIIDGVLHIRLTDANFSIWNIDIAIDANLKLMILIMTLIAGVILITAGSVRSIVKKSASN